MLQAMTTVLSPKHLRLCVVEGQRNENVALRRQWTDFNMRAQLAVFNLNRRNRYWNLGKVPRLRKSLVCLVAVAAQELQASIHHHLRRVGAGQVQPVSVSLLP